MHPVLLTAGFSRNANQASQSDEPILGHPPLEQGEDLSGKYPEPCWYALARSVYRAVTFAIVLILMSGIPLRGQINPLMQEGSTPVPNQGHDYLYGFNETVSPATGDVTFSLPLKMPLARGFTLPVSITYNSGSAHRFLSTIEGCGGFDNRCATAGNNFLDRAHEGNGWTDTLPYVTASGFTAISSSPNQGPGITTDCPMTTSYNLFDVKGSSHALDIAALGAPSSSSGQGGGDCSHTGYGGANQYTSSYLWDSRQGDGDDFVSATAEANCTHQNALTIPDCAAAQPSFRVVDQSGNTYSFPVNGFNFHFEYNGNQGSSGNGINFQVPQKLTDRNGNVTTFNHNSGDYDVIDSITDSVGRQALTFQRSSNAMAYIAGPLTYTLNYTTTSAQYSSPAVHVNLGVDSGPCSRTDSTFSTTNETNQVVGSIALPNSTNFTFAYEQTYGLVNSITYPGGGHVDYTWKLNDSFSDLAVYDGQSESGGLSLNGCVMRYKTPAVATRTVYYSANVKAQTQVFTYATNWDPNSPTLWLTKTTTVDTTDNTNGRMSRIVYTYTPTQDPVHVNEGGRVPPQIPVESQIAYYDWGAGSPGPLLRTVQKTWGDKAEMTSEATSEGQVSQLTNYCYNPSNCSSYGGFPGRLAEKDEYDYNSTQKPLRKTLYTWGYTDQPGTVVQDGSGNRVAETDIYYDGQTANSRSIQPTSGVSGLIGGTHDETSYGPSSTLFRSNPTSIVEWNNLGASSTWSYQYDETGQLLSVTDPCGSTNCSDMDGSSHTTTYSYADKYDDQQPAADANGNRNTNAFMTSVTLPTVGQITQTLARTYNYQDGSLSTSTDSNSQTTSYSYESGFRRLHIVQGPKDPQNNGFQATTTYNYIDSAPSPSVTTTTAMNSGQNLIRELDLDGLGHVVLQQLTSDPQGTDFVAISYDGMGDVYAQSNPYRGSASSPPASQTTTYIRDALGRVVVESHGDQTEKLTCYNGQASVATNNCSPNASSNTATAYTDTSDEAGVHWQHMTDGLGRLVAVMEPNRSSGATTVETDYKYDLLDNLISAVQQGDTSGNPDGSMPENPRSRSFSYDSLSRLVTAYNPESNWTCYGTVPSGQFPNASNCSSAYDLNGNLAYKTTSQPDNNGNAMQLTYRYDPLDRLTYKGALTDPDNLQAYLGYDQGTNGKGRLTSESRNGVAGEGYAYDVMGRVQATSWVDYSGPGHPGRSGMGAVYDGIGNPISLTYPDGRVLTQQWDAAGRLQTITDSTANKVLFQATAANGSSSGYYNSATYWPNGSLANAQLGTSFQESFAQNERMQPAGMMAGTALVSGNSSSNIVNRQIFYTSNTQGSAPCAAQATQNNGNIYSLVDNLQAGMTQVFSYDQLNRIHCGTNPTPSSVGQYSHIYPHDSFGNTRVVDQIQGDMGDTIDPGTNRLYIHGGYLGYDNAGDLTDVPDPGAGNYHHLLYTSEGYLRCFDGCQLGSYLIDAIGHRSFAAHGSTWNEYVYLNGQVMADTEPSGNWADYVYANGQKIAKIDSTDAPLHFSGDKCSNCGGSVEFVEMPGAGNRVVESGDTLNFSQYSTGASAGGGVMIFFSDGSWAGTGGASLYDTDGQPIDCDSRQNQWHQRHVDLSPFAGKTLGNVWFVNSNCTPGGHYDLYLNDASVAGNGIVSTLYSPRRGATFNPRDWQQYPGTASNMRAVGEANSSAPASQTHFFLNDPLGTLQMELSAQGWPTWQGQFTPYGQEITGGGTLNAIGPQPNDGTAERYKFTGKERDAESGLDYFGARHYISVIGRFTSPDWASKPEAVPYASLDNPQSLNLYTYVLNDPLSKADMDGHCIPWCTALIGAAVGAAGEVLSESLSGQPIQGKRIAAAALGGAVAGAFGPLGALAGYGTVGAAAFTVGGSILGDAAENITNSALSGKQETSAPLTAKGVVGDVALAGAQGIAGAQAHRVGAKVGQALEQVGNGILDTNRRVQDNKQNKPQEQSSPQQASPKKRPMQPHYQADHVS